MEWFNTLTNGEMTITTMAVLFIALLVGLLILFWLFRKIFGSTSSRLSKGRQPRLSVTDAAVVDDKRRLVLVRRDNVEHLVMIGGPTDVVIEQNIVRAAPVDTTQSRIAPATAPGAQAVPPAAAASQPASSTHSTVETAPAPQGRSNDDGFFPSKTEAAAASTLAAGAGVAATTQNAASSLSGIVRDTTASATQAAEKLVESTKETVSDTAQAASSGFDSVSGKVTEVSENLSAGLDAALSPDNNGEPTKMVTSPIPEVGSAEGHEGTQANKTEDEMQRLLDELSSSKN